VEQFDKWINSGRPNSFWLTGFFNPTGLLTAMRQETARQNKWPLDDCTLRNEVTKMDYEQVKEAPSTGMYVHGLFLDGAAWDKKEMSLVDSPPKVLSWPLPVVWLTAVQKKDLKYTWKTYECPVFKSQQRGATVYIFPLQLKTDVNPKKWIFRGVALLGSTA